MDELLYERTSELVIFAWYHGRYDARAKSILRLLIQFRLVKVTVHFAQHYYNCLIFQLGTQRIKYRKRLSVRTTRGSFTYIHDTHRADFSFAPSEIDPWIFPLHGDIYIFYFQQIFVDWKFFRFLFSHNLWIINENCRWTQRLDNGA